MFCFPLADGCLEFSTALPATSVNQSLSSTTAHMTGLVRSSWILLSNVWDHRTGRYLKGLRIPAICWSDGTNCLPVDFALLSSSDAKNRLCDNHKSLDKSCCAYQRRKEATEKATAHWETMVKRILLTGISAK
jgi:hypothetical protein